MTDVRERLAELSPAQRASVAERTLVLCDRGHSSIRGGLRESPPAASFAQERLWFVESLQPGRGVYNIAVAIPFEGPLNPRALGDALAWILRRHETLRTTYTLDG